MRTEDRSQYEYSPCSARIKGHDYTRPGAYFITICTFERIGFFGNVVNAEIQLNTYGDIAYSCWQQIPEHFPGVLEAPFVVMPNHIHGIIIISNRSRTPASVVETRHAVSKNIETFQKPVARSLPTIIRSYKSSVTRELNALNEFLPVTVWQRNYFERIIRNKSDFNRAMDYIKFNPAKWADDENNPVNLTNHKNLAVEMRR
jgi:putative transposase